MLLRWKKDNLKFVSLIPMPGLPTPTKASIMLLPGVNEISMDEWALIEPHVKDSVARGDLEVVQEKTAAHPGKQAEIAQSLVDVPAKRCRVLIAETVNPATLNHWLAIENRDEIRRLIKDRIDELKIVVKPEEEIPESPSFDATPADAPQATPAVPVAPDTAETAPERGKPGRKPKAAQV